MQRRFTLWPPGIRVAERSWLWAAMALALAGALVHTVFGYSWKGTSGHAFGSDDAFITYRYAQNLWQGHGLVFNPGEPVEGYSNFLYTLLVTPAFAFGPGAVYPLSIALNCACVLGTIWLFWRHVEAELGPAAARLGVLLLALSPWIWANVATGLETPLVLLITTALWVSISRKVAAPRGAPLWGLGALCVLSMLARVDGFILPVAVALFLAIRGRMRAALVIGTLTLAVMTLYTGARMAYYGDVIANTYYAKVSGPLMIRIQSGLAFIWDHALATGLWAGLAAAAAALIRMRRDLFGTMDFAIWALGVWTAYLIYIGGDIYYERFLIAMLPLGLYVLLRELGTWASGLRALAVFALLGGMPLWFAAQDGRFAYGAAGKLPKYDFWIETGRFLKERHPGAVLAIDAAGKVPFVTGFETIDMLGLNNRHIGKMDVSDATRLQGHMKYDPDYVLERSPDLIAAWFTRDLDLAWGLTRARYAPGYELAYVVNPARQDLGARNIIDVRAMTDAAVLALFKEGYLYAVLVRRDMK